MGKRFVTIWFRHLATDGFCLRMPALFHSPLALALPDHGRRRITAVNAAAEKIGVYPGMVVADARAIFPALEVFDDQPGLTDKLLQKLALRCIRFTPAVAVDSPDGLILDATGCAHLWGGEPSYLKEMSRRLFNAGFDVRISIADTMGAAWATARFGKQSSIVPPGQHTTLLLSFPPEALRIEPATVERLHKLGLRQIRDFITMPRSALLRRFGKHFISRLNQAFGQQEEIIEWVQPLAPWQERLPCLEPIATATGIEIALNRLLDILCTRLQQQGKGIRKAVFKGYRLDGKIEQVEIGTNRPSSHAYHLFKLFENKLDTIAPDLGIELFVLEAPKVDDVLPVQEKLWEQAGGLNDHRLSELIDRLESRLGAHRITRFLPVEHHWPERSIRPAADWDERSNTSWDTDKPRPMQLLPVPAPIEVTAPIPDYPPMLFRYKGNLHTISKSDGPERIEREWWIDAGQHRDYYIVEDQQGQRYWIFRSGHYTER